MTQWAVVIPAEQYETERLYHHDEVTVESPAGAELPADGDEALIVVAGEHPLVIGLGRIVAPAPATAPAATAAPAAGGRTVVVAYTRRAFDAPVPAPRLALGHQVQPLDPATYRDLAARLGVPADRRTWLVSVDLPIEAESPAEAVRQFWSYVRQLGPRELPTFVWPSGNELAMQAFVLGEEANQDPEEDEDDD
ncbi:hypothetical protein [Spirilliplanes yamanashiensis]|uniref:Uncharacterized protein n=1 Tax=Spirilliplanes yamanashiensis TaxID=42233 RepID=A0A8J3Y348_9ACTN|nr:hypothetical protein [Spirilliplanes yamanashiensis]MDP9814292.1 hypothetical protein [Spirilliplanes yamanashiensis]GIJ00725.1 hypothetical protein Sya03_00770 [Spirilliplanes yamanashiensis]